MVGDCALPYLQPSRIVTLRNLIPCQKPRLLSTKEPLSRGDQAYVPKLLGRCKLHASGTWRAFGYFGYFNFQPDFLKFLWLTLKQASWGSRERIHEVTQTCLGSAAPQVSGPIFPRSPNHHLCLISPEEPRYVAMGCDSKNCTGWPDNCPPAQPDPDIAGIGV
jgi:hypothetical protein